MHCHADISTYVLSSESRALSMISCDTWSVAEQLQFISYGLHLRCNILITEIWLSEHFSCHLDLQDSRIYWFLSRNEKDTHFSFFLFHGEQHPRKFIIHFEFILFLYNNFKLRWLKDVNPLLTLSSVTISMAAGMQVHGPTKFQPETFAPTR